MGGKERILFSELFLTQCSAKMPIIYFPNNTDNNNNNHRPDDLSWVLLPPPLFFGRQVLPLEDKVPVKAATQVSRRPNVLEAVHADDVNDGTHHTRPILMGEWGGMC